MSQTSPNAALPAAPLARLSAGSSSWVSCDAGGRAALALETAQTVAAQADRWVEVSLAIKAAALAHSAQHRSAIEAEEAATGPLATLRLLLLTAEAWREIAERGLPAGSRTPRIEHPAAGSAGPASFIGVEVLPESKLHDQAIFQGHRATVRCVNPGGIAAFEATWREEVAERPMAGGVAAVLAAGNVTGLGPADAICQIFEHGRAVALKPHPLHAPLESVYREAFAPLFAAGVLAIVPGGAETARDLAAATAVTHVHLTGGQAAFDALVWGGQPAAAGGQPRLAKPITCELGNVTPWIIVPGRYTARQLRYQADLAAASIANNTSFNCIATKCLVTCRDWPQREEFLGHVTRRLNSLASRQAWFPGSAAAWAEAAGRSPPDDGTLPWYLARDVDPVDDRRLLEREWFGPVAADVALAAADTEAFCGHATDFVRGLPGSLAASVTIPETLSQRDRQRAELLVEHLRYGVVAVNTWSALAYALGSVPWGGYPGGTLVDPGSGIGRVHDPLMLPLVHNTILRAPLAGSLTPAWVPWHRSGRQLARGVLSMYAAIARGGRGFGPLLRMLPAVVWG
ncbi:MAG: aldehyde dehydrogenase family protein [Planctomycetota bacterium]|nr:aldehyde dehydrogenase family protein [Planctomycetota bacterium]MDA1201035.1 aldehyde dehydrogenase family protein [Planctomycetota bacterium]